MSLRRHRISSLATIGLTPYNGRDRCRTRRGRTPSQSFQIQQAVIETLERRQLMSGNPIIVTDPNDDGTAASLRNTIESAASGATIEFAPTGNSTLTLSGPITLAQNVTIIGQSNPTISGGNTGGIFIVGSGATVMISGLNLTGGNAAGGL